MAPCKDSERERMMKHAEGKNKDGERSSLDKLQLESTWRTQHWKGKLIQRIVPMPDNSCNRPWDEEPSGWPTLLTFKLRCGSRRARRYGWLPSDPHFNAIGQEQTSRNTDACHSDRRPYLHFIMTTEEQDLRRAPQVNVEQWQDEGAGAGKAQGNCAGAPRRRANSGV